MGIELILLPKF